MNAPAFLTTMATGSTPSGAGGIDPSEDPVLLELHKEYLALRAEVEANGAGDVTFGQYERIKDITERVNTRLEELGLKTSGVDWRLEYGAEVLAEMEGRVITPDDWRAKLGVENLGVVPPLPAELNEFMNQECSITKDGRLRKETHILCFVPSELDGVPFSAASMRELVMERYPDGEYYSSNDMQTENFSLPLSSALQEKGEWVLLCTEMPEETMGKTYDDQEPLIASYQMEGYDTPYAREMLAALVMHAVVNGEREFATTWGFCQDVDEASARRALVGDFVSSGFFLDMHDPTDRSSDLGRALLARF